MGKITFLFNIKTPLYCYCKNNNFFCIIVERRKSVAVNKGKEAEVVIFAAEFLLRENLSAVGGDNKNYIF